jgi:signal peptidase I
VASKDRRRGESRRRKAAGDARREREGRVRGGRTVGGEAWEWVKTLVTVVVLLIVIRSFLVQTFVITSGSMEDTLLVGDFLMVNRLALGTRLPGTMVRTPGYSRPDRWQVVVFDPAHEDRMKLVKRIVGMPGDTLEMRDKQLLLNGELQNEPWVKWLDFSGDDEHPWMRWQQEHLLDDADPDEYRPSRDNWGPLAVPAEHYFMLGDNRDFSLDSRYWGLVEDWRLEGRAMFFYFSYERGSPTPFAFLREARWERIGRRIR